MGQDADSLPNDGELISRLEALSDEEFLELFRDLLSPTNFGYGDSYILANRYFSILVLLSDIPPHRIEKCLLPYEK